VSSEPSRGRATPARAVGRASRRATPWRAATFLAVAALAQAACSASTPTAAAPTETAVPIAQTPWASGTVGQYGLRIDPSLLGRLPATVESLYLVEDATSEEQDMNNADLAKYFDSYAAAAIGIVSNANWLNVAIGILKPEGQNADFYSSWVSEYATGACSQADGVASTSQETINDWSVDVATCAGGPVVYTLMLDSDTLLSMWGMGPRDLGRKLIGLLH
jgi:hypothetical protein